MVKSNNLQILLILCVLFTSVNSVKWWMENYDFSNGNSWENGEPPCNLDSIQFPEEYSAGIILPTDLKTIGLILPINGALLLNKNSQITFRAENSGKECTNRNNLAQLKSIKQKSWFDPNNWGVFPGRIENNSAKPHGERIPCFNEKAVIDHNGPLSIDLNDITKIKVGGIHLAGYDTSTEYVNSFLKTELGEIIFKNASSTEFEFYPEESSCSCFDHDEFELYRWEVCKYAAPCEIPNCRDPINPIGGCCHICGAQLLLNSSDCRSETLNKFTDSLKHSIISEEYQNKINFYASFVRPNTIQLIVVDQNGYNGYSVEFMKTINGTILKDIRDRILISSGTPIYPSSSHGWIIVAITFLAVFIFFMILYTYFVPENRIITLPAWLYPNSYNVFQSPLVFARFHNAHQDADTNTSNVVVLDVAYNDPEQKLNEGSTSFNNPLFEENIATNIESDEEQELTEIDLETL